MSRSPLELGTISFARCQTEMLLSPAERVRLILAASYAYEPDLLVTAGYAIHSRKHLRKLANGFLDEEREGVIITEVHWDGRPQRSIGRSHAMWAVNGQGDLHRYGRQAFATSNEVRSKGGHGLLRFRRKMLRRFVPVGEYSTFGLICGELNIVHSRADPTFVDAKAGAAILAADIVVNPTHDRMSNAGTLQAKRSFLSQSRSDGRARVYVSCSNWEACGLNGRVQYPSPTLHTVYVSGQPIEYEELADGAFGFVYRRWKVPLDEPG